VYSTVQKRFHVILKYVCAQWFSSWHTSSVDDQFSFKRRTSSSYRSTFRILRNSVDKKCWHALYKKEYRRACTVPKRVL